MKNAVGKQMMAGNWKMNNGPAQTKKYFEELKTFLRDGECEVVLCVPFPSMQVGMEIAEGMEVVVGAQNCHWEQSGAFTGEVSAEMLVECGIKVVIVGHSERRQYFGETDETVNGRIKAAISKGLTVIFCVGESLSQRENGSTNEVVATQLKLGLAGVTVEQMGNVVIAYEPVWAIGTGVTATPEQAQETIAHIREVVAQLYDKGTAAKTIILYGGSMNGGNAEELLKQPDINGGLIGGASLKPEEFAGMVAVVNKL